MLSRFSWLILSMALPVCLASPRASAAPDRIGLAVTVRNEVSQIEPKASKILPGDDVVRDEVIQTLADSNAKIVLKDSTNLMLGPGSRLKLDRTVFSDETTVGDIAIKLTVGSFRFITGHSAKESYSIATPIATMGVRGTTLDILIERFKNTVVLKDGQSRVCAAGKCVELLKVGDTAVVTKNGTRIDIDVQPSSTWSFDSACNGMCSPISFAEAESSLTTGNLGGGGGSGGPTASPIGPGGQSSGNAGESSSPQGTKNGFSGLLLGAALSSVGFVQVSPR